MPLRITDALIDRYLACRRTLGPLPWTDEQRTRAREALGLSHDEVISLLDVIGDVIRACRSRALTPEELERSRERLAGMDARAEAATTRVIAEMRTGNPSHPLAKLAVRIGANDPERLAQAAERARAMRHDAHRRILEELDRRGDKERSLNAAAAEYGAENVEAVLRRLEDLLGADTSHG